MKACPGPRSGIDRCGSLSFAIRGIASPFATSLRHSGEGRNPEGKGGINHTQTPPTTRSHFHTFVCRRPPAWAIGTKIVIRCHRIRHSRGSGNPEGKGGTNHTQTPPTTRSHFHTFVCRHQPACAIAMKECPGPRSGIDRCGSLSFAIRDIPSPFAASLRHSRHPSVNPAPHSSFRRRPESRGEGWHQPHPNTSNDQASISYLGAPAPAGMDDRYENRLPPPVSSFQRKLESRRRGVGDRDEDVDDGAAPVGRNAAACLLGPWLGTSASATFLPLHRGMQIHGSGNIGWPA